jgi:uncharacterized protein YkwD
MRRIISILFLTLVLCPGCISADPMSLADIMAKWDPSWSENELGMLDEINRYRSEGAVCGDETFAPTHPLELDETIQIASRLHSEDMGLAAFFDHVSLDGRTFSERMTAVGFAGAYPWGENIQAGSATAAEATASLMASVGHCENMMSPEFYVIGIGYAQVPESPYQHYWTQNFAGGH